MNSDHQELIFHTSVRWLSKGNVLNRVHELINEVKIFLSSNDKKYYLSKKIDNEFKINLAYLADIFELLNSLNRSLQGPDTTIIMHTDCINAFISKLALWLRKIEAGNLYAFPRLAEEFGEDNLTISMKKCIKDHFLNLQNEFKYYFPSKDAIEMKSRNSKKSKNCIADELPDYIQEEYTDFINNRQVQDDFKRNQEINSLIIAGQH